MENIQTISAEQIRTLCAGLKKLNEQWAKDLSDAISSDKKNGDPNMNVTKIHNINNSKTKNQRLRRMMIYFGVALLKKYQDQTNTAMGMLNSVSSEMEVAG